MCKFDRVAWTNRGHISTHARIPTRKRGESGPCGNIFGYDADHVHLVNTCFSFGVVLTTATCDLKENQTI